MGLVAAVLVVLTVLAPASASSQSTAAPDSATTTSRLQFWPPKLNALGVVWTPQVRVNRRIGVGLGLETLIAYRKSERDPDAPPATLQFKLMGTTRNQWRLSLANDVRWDGGRDHARIKLDHDNLARRFWGLGPDSDGSDPEVYRPQSTLLYGEALLGFSDRLRIGPRLELHHQAVHEVDGGSGQSDTVRDTRAGLVTGAGVVAAYDTRDCRVGACRGLYWQTMAMAFMDGVRDQRFEVFNVDLRGYVPLTTGSVLAWQGFYYGVTDGAPFWRLASLGGRAHSRAYSRDRWLDENLIAFQLEWRWRVTGRFGLTPFAGAALVNRDLAEVHAAHFKPSIGLGLRRYPRPGKPPVPVRLDFAVGHRHARVVLAVGEAF